MSSSSALPQTLKSITATKIKELAKQRKRFEERKDKIFKDARDAPDLRSRVQVLLEGVTKLNGDPNDAFDKEDLDVEDAEEQTARVADCSDRATYTNIRRFLLQSQYDPSVSENSLRDWIAQLEEELRSLELKHKHAAFYSDLVTEWLETLEAEQSASKEFESVGRAEMQEQRATWESLVFSTTDVNVDAIRAYLDGLFNTTPLTQQALKELRERVKSFGTEFAAKKEWFSVADLEWVSKSLLKTDLLTKEKMGILREFMRNKAVAQEVADVLNMRLAALDSWHWPEGGIPVEMRRQLNGKYRVFMDEDLLDSLLFQYLGLKWSVTFKNAFKAFFRTRAWQSPRQQISKEERERRRYFLGSTGRGGCVNDYRRQMYETQYFMTQLPSSVEAGVPEYGDEANSDNITDGEKRKNHLETKHALLHLLITESIIHTTLYGQFTAICSDFKWFGSSLSHATVLAVLEYFGVLQNWLHFFTVFLEAPLKFTQDGENAAVQVRRRGAPISHTLSDCFSETVLFCMDYAVNQSTEGAYLYRLHDDFWFWGREQTCVKAWGAMTKFAKVMGLEFNEEKTGTVRLTKPNPRQGSPVPAESEHSSSLPTGDIRWGFLKLDPQEGRFIIDQSRVDGHIAELGHQLAACKSIFAWVQAWNSYFARFFTNNFGKPAMCFGRGHIDMAISTLSRIERTLFPDGVTSHLRQMIADRFGVRDLPDGFFYFPVDLGGLQLLNPYIPLLGMREDIKQTPQRRLQKAFLEDEDAWHAAKERFEKDGPCSAAQIDFGDDDSPATFMSLDEFMRYPESSSQALLQAYKDLIRIPEEVSVSQTAGFRSSVMSLRKTGSGDGRGITESWLTMTPYWRWTAEVYHEEMVRKFGGLAAVSREFMPLGVVETLREGKFRWQG
ncbi:hypothetical protein KXV81_003935 [Aspergillus fumigatus]|jgi:hypothetical protein|nr:hypothetical protein KXX45_003772 [Aspergillus fumigatus]KAH1281124.1 hypothetical protein KXX48_004043 [Aspergillus fumigatus]KAH1313409.1 hypothetical protein KXX38_003948 [Aspergillus fumigatus]KAH1399844.1 hypothetical protein KXX49_006581 [Aspergillus fumigatus]KAH1412837.1 hypothetical protein KXX51_005873 [Aspergillus fumigatus]